MEGDILRKKWKYIGGSITEGALVWINSPGILVSGYLGTAFVCNLFVVFKVGAKPFVERGICENY